MANTKISQLPAWTPTDVAEIPFVEWGVTYKGLKSLLNWADGNWIDNIALLSTVWLIKTYRVTYTDTTTFDYFTTDGTDWAWTVNSIVWWTNTTVDNTDPTNPIVNTTQIDISWKQDILLEWAFVDWDKTKLDSASTLTGSETLTNKTVNWVVLNSTGSATNYLQEDWSYWAIAWGGWLELLSTVSISSTVSSIDFDSTIFNWGHRGYVIIWDIVGQTNTHLECNISSDNLSTFKSIQNFSVFNSTSASTRTLITNVWNRISWTDAVYNIKPCQFIMNLRDTSVVAWDVRVNYSDTYTGNACIAQSTLYSAGSWNSIRIQMSVYWLTAGSVSIYWLIT